MLFDGRVHVLSWVKDAVSENTKYECSFISKVGNTASEVLITAEDKGRLVLNVCCVCVLILIYNHCTHKMFM